MHITLLVRVENLFFFFVCECVCISSEEGVFRKDYIAFFDMKWFYVCVSTYVCSFG